MVVGCPANGRKLAAVDCCSVTPPFTKQTCRSLPRDGREERRIRISGALESLNIISESRRLIFSAFGVYSLS